MKITTTWIAGLLLTASSTVAIGQAIYVVPVPSQRAPDAAATTAPSLSTPQASRSEQRSNLRRQMTSEGFQNIRISDAMFFVQAQTPDGREVLMVVRPVGQEQQVSRSNQGGDDAYSYSANAQAAPDFQGGPAATAQPGQGLTAYGRTPSAEESTGSVQAGMISEDQVRSQLQARGFSNLRHWQREGSIYTATADWYGQEVDVRVDALSGEVLQPRTLQNGQVRSLLGAQGFSNVRGIDRQGDMITVQADRSGTTYTIQIDPRQAEIEDRTRQGTSDNSQDG